MKRIIPELQEEILNEQRILHQLNHKNIINLYATYLNSNYQMTMILEYCEKGSLLDKIKEKKKTKQIFIFEEIKNIILGISEGLLYLKKNSIIHRDLKPSNILFTDEEETVKIIDFGNAARSKGFQGLIDENSVGTNTYRAPESSEGIYSYKSDIYSLGVIFVVLLDLKLPNLVPGELLDFWEKYPIDGLNDVVNKMLDVDPEERIDIEFVISDLSLI